jgi:hypothetical protein
MPMNIPLGYSMCAPTLGGTYINAPNERADALGVDAESLTGATRLYQRAGMAVVR